MENLLVVFRCPHCYCGMKIIKIGEDGALFKCPTHGDIHSDSMKIKLTNKEPAWRDNAIIYRLLPDLSFANILVTQSSFDADSVEKCEDVTQFQKLILLNSKDKQKVEIFTGNRFSKERFQERMEGHTSLLDS